MPALLPSRRVASGTPPAARRVLAALASLTALAVAATGCGYGSAADEAAANAPKAHGRKLSADTVRIGYFPNLTHGTALVGDQKGFFQQELGGTQAEYARFSAGPSEIEALNSGGVDIGWLGPSPAINGYAASHGKDLRIIGGSASGGVKLVVNPEKIRSVGDVKGKRIATPQLGNTQDVAFLDWIRQQGWQVDAQSGKGDVSVVRTDNKITPNAYRSGSIDGAWVPEPTASRLVAQGARVLLDESELWPQKKFVITNIVVAQPFLKEHPDVVAAVLRGSVRANAFIHDHPDAAQQAANAKLKQLSGKALPEKVIDPAWRSIRFTDDPLAATLRTEASHAVRAGLLTAPDLHGIYDLTELNKILASRGRPAVDAAGLGAQ